MALAAKSTKAYVRSNKTATIVCPACGVPKIINTGQLKKTQHSVKMKCRCNTVFTVEFDYRRYYRKKTNLPGTYAILTQGSGGGVIHIQDISKGGIGFNVSGVHTLRQDQVIGVEFRLNDRNQSKIKKRAVVRSVVNNKIGCQFEDLDETGSTVGKALGFYLQGIE